MTHLDKNLILQDRLFTDALGEVYRGQRAESGTVVESLLVRIIGSNLAEAPQFRERVLSEAQLLAELRPPQTTRIIDHGWRNQKLFLATEAVEGIDTGSLLTALKERRRLMPLATACYLISAAAKGLESIHGLEHHSPLPLQVVHRVITPKTILVNCAGQAQLTFGAMTEVDAGQAALLSAVSPAATSGFTPYSAPEQLTTEIRRDSLTDIYCLGLVFYELLSGALPFRADTAASYRLQLAHQEFVPPLHPELDDKSRELLLRMLAKERSQRFQSAFDLHSTIDRFVRERFPRFVPAEVAQVVTSVLAVKRQDDEQSESPQVGQTDERTRSEAVSSSFPKAPPEHCSDQTPTPVSRTPEPPRAKDTRGRRPSPARNAAFGAALCLLVVFGGILWKHRGAEPGTTAGVPDADAIHHTRGAKLSPAISAGVVAPRAPDTILGLVTWFDASNITLPHDTPVEAWVGAVGATIALRQTEPARQPRLAKNARLTGVRFNGLTTFLESPELGAAIRQANAFTILYVAAVDTAKDQYVFSMHGANRFLDVARAGFSVDGRLRLKVDNSVGSYLDSSPTIVDHLAVYTSAVGESTSLLRQNGINYIRAGHWQPPQLDRTVYFSIGQEWDPSGPSDYFAGVITDIVVYTRVLDTNELLSLEKYFIDLRAIALP
ncbi:MAG: protein kinase [Bdellovibrionales bacterium]|nr:protein kinase [Bdellovibrionales bacterium]